MWVNKTTVSGPIFIKGPPPIKQHTKPLCGHRKAHCGFTVIETLGNGKRLSRPHVYKGSFPPQLNNTKNHCMGTQNHCVIYCNQNTTGKPLLRPHVYTEFPPPKLNNTHNHCVCTKPLCGFTVIKTLLKNRFQGPMFIKGPRTEV